MFKYLRKRKGQSSMELVIIMIIVMAALLSIQVYLKRGVQGRLRSAADDVGDQYSAGNTNVRKVVTVVSNTHEVQSGGSQTTNMNTPEVTTTNRTQNIVNLQQEYWGN